MKYLKTIRWLDLAISGGIASIANIAMLEMGVPEWTSGYIVCAIVLNLYEALKYR